jgi:flagellar assembly protein FliH
LSRRVVTREAFAESDVQRYAHVALHQVPPFLSAGQAGDGMEEGASGSSEGSFSEDNATEGQEAAPMPSVEEIVAAVQQQADELISLARQEAERLRQEAHAQGVASGYAEGREQARLDLQLALVAFAQLGQSLIVLEEQLIERFTSQLVRFALDIAEKVVGKAVEEDPQIVASVLTRARAELPQARSIRIWLHPLDHQALQACRPDLVLIGEKGGRTVEVVSSDDVERGGCRVETEMGVVDATIPVQMQEIRRQMLD